ncbi:MAG: ankyrin repeat domain-containing protein [bacterium]
MNRLFVYLFLLLFFCMPAAASNIHDMINHGDLQGISALIEASPELLNATDNEGLTLLHWAVIKEQTNIVKFLLARGANIAVYDKNGLTPLDWATRLKRSNLVQYLQTLTTETTIHTLAKNGDITGLAALLKANPAFLNARDEDWSNPSSLRRHGAPK